MATSGTYSFSLNRNETIKRAFQAVNIYDINATPTSDDVAYANSFLNMILLHWSNQGIRLWKRKTTYLFPAKGVAQYAIPTSHITDSYISTTLLAPHASGDELADGNFLIVDATDLDDFLMIDDDTYAEESVLLGVTSTAGMTVGDHIGVELDSGERAWTTIATIPSSTTLTTTVPIGGAATAGNSIITYTNTIARPHRIIRGTTLDLETETETTMAPLTYDEYFNQPAKTTPGTPNNFHYDKKNPSGQLYFFPVTNDVNKIITFTRLDPIEDTGDPTDEIDIPKEWLLALVWALAAELAFAYGEYPALDKIQAKAEKLFEEIKWYDTDDESVYMAGEV